MISALRTLTRWASSLPWRLAPFATVLEMRRDERRGIHQPEDFSGSVNTPGGERIEYSEPVSLLDQTAPSEVMEGRYRYNPDGAVISQPKSLYRLQRGCLITQEGIVYCPDTRAAVAETVKCWDSSARNHWLFRSPRFPDAQALVGTTLSLVTLSAEGFYHFLVEALPRLSLAKSWLDRIDHFVINAGGFQRAWLMAAGVDPSRIILATPHMHFACDDLLFTGPVIADCQPDPWVRRSLNELFPHAGSQPLRNLWISRADAKARHLTWEDELLAHLPGFERISLSTHSPLEQVRAFRSAKVVAGPHGAGLANVLFSPAVRLIELFPANHYVPLYSRCAAVAGGKAAWAGVDFERPERVAELAGAVARFLRN